MTIEISRDRLKALHDACDMAIKEVRSRRTAALDFEPINWGDLGCVEAGIKITEDAHQYFYVLIEEASPHCDRLRGAIREELIRRGWNDVEVIVEW